jgi:hypothetical protein
MMDGELVVWEQQVLNFARLGQRITAGAGLGSWLRTIPTSRRMGECGHRHGPILPGELAQCDLWLPPVDVPLGYGQVGRPPVPVMVRTRWSTSGRS